ncbi:Crp/Fnr family transcriptional regulator [Leptospira kanakyensis]|uniref:Crp/Fnr family transcriptional regulator n=1 Tax=Leptospira kanakyensis TaxID=2484968 RepID=A0A6N4PVW6_9LEPT|nr:cyclic nucleotide-binding domain-containing protein [Leptospira kanakyensis]MCW7482360.1 cyclic nucleotide-binding domain-containing protein [Leptospira kanakyensis]TGK49262.1 Crp/Fnr family transcriptional regulator [Leptospira kanakyensis]TGK60496.1 Crp/Fnr family transcriptional regulator [Leptospira kanakyensis]TGK67896.1 Crp/Fnr family transcriptional regulator [Leptospira kanakyensis]
MSVEEIKVVNYSKGAAIVVQNSINTGNFFIVRSGRVSVDSEHIVVDHELAFYEAGDSFGLVSALTEHRFLVTLFADTDVELVQIPIRLLGSYLKERKELAMKILGLYSRELRTLQKHLSKANKPADREYHPERLVQNARTYLSWQKPNIAAYSIQSFLNWSKENHSTENLTEAKDLLKSFGSNYKPFVWDSMQANLEPGEILFVESEKSNEIYVVLEGNVKLFGIVRGFEYVIDVLGPGEIFGEMSLIDNAPRMASAITETKSKILRVTAENLFESVGPSLLQKIFESIARRIWFSHQRLVILRLKTPVIRLYAYLYNSIRDQDIRLGRNLDESLANAHTIYIQLEELCNMCGIIKVKSESIQEFLSDTNLVIEPNRITIKSRKRLEEKLGHYKSKEGQIVA